MLIQYKFTDWRTHCKFRLFTGSTTNINAIIKSIDHHYNSITHRMACIPYINPHNTRCGIIIDPKGHYEVITYKEVAEYFLNHTIHKA